MSFEIQEIIDRETRAWNEKSVDLLLSIFHPDMVWVWPTEARGHDPMTWTSMLGKFDQARWSAVYRDLFSQFELAHNRRETRRVFVTAEGDGAFAVVDIDTLWRGVRSNGNSTDEMHWLGRTCKTYVRTADGWKMIAQVGVLDYSDL